MLPESIFGSYKQYKNDTSAFTTWLGRAAEACGYAPKPRNSPNINSTTVPSSNAKQAKPTPAPNTPSARLKGKARRLAKQAQELQPSAAGFTSEEAVTVKKYSVNTKDLEDQINFVSQSKKSIYIPSGIKRALERAIEARQRCSEWNETAKPETTKLDNDGHRSFIGLLKRALSAITAASKPEKGDLNDSQRTSTKASSKTTNRNVVGSQNRFSTLEVEDTDDNFDLSPTQVALATTHDPKKVDSVDVYELEAEQEFDAAFAIFCFFEDLHRVRRRIQQVWVECSTGRTSLVSTNVVTQAAIQSVHRAEQELLPLVSSARSTADSYELFASTMVRSEIIMKGIDPRSGSTVDVTPFDDFIFLPIARTILKFINMAVGTGIQWPPPIFPLRFNYLTAPHKAERPEAKKLQRDDEILSQLLLDLYLPDHAEEMMKGGHDARYPPQVMDSIQDDILVKTMRPIWTKGTLSAASVFSAQVVLDIIESCQAELPTFYKQLDDARRYASEPFQFREINGKLTTGDLNWPSSGVENLYTNSVFLNILETPRAPIIKALLLQTITPPKVFTWANSPPEMRARWDERPPPGMEAMIERLGMTDFIRPAEAPDFASTHNPLSSSAAMLRMLVGYHTAGISLANHQLSIFVVAHLYNALRQLNMLETKWDVMERVIELHKKAIFADAVPTKTRDIMDRFVYRTDAYQKRKDVDKEGRFKFREAASMQVLRQLLDEEPCKPSRGLHLLEQQVEAVFSVSSQTSNSVKHSSMRKPTEKSYFINIQTIADDMLADISIDYIRLTKRCLHLMTNFRRMWNIENEAQGLEIRFKPIRDGNNTNDIGHLYICHEAFGEAKAVRKMGLYSYEAGDGDDKALKGGNPDTKDPFRHGMGLMTASKVFKKFLEEEKAEFAFPLGYARDLSTSRTSDERTMAASSDLLARLSNKWRVHTLTSALDFHSLLEDNTYVLVNFYADYDRTHNQNGMVFVDFAAKHGVPGILAFARANVDDMRSLASKYVREMGRQSFFAFKEGRQVAVNGKSVVYGGDGKGLRAAAEKLGGLARKRVAERDAKS